RRRERRNGSRPEGRFQDDPFSHEAGVRGMSTITATREQEVVASVRKDLYIGGEWREASGGGRVAIEDPATRATIAEVADGTPDDALAALAAAGAAQAAWAKHPPRERGEILRRAFELIAARADDLALL